LKKTQTLSKALAQNGYTDMPGFLSIQDADFAGFVVKKVEKTIGGQVSKITIDKQLQPEASYW